MPEVGEYWYCAHGSAEVVRVVEADDEVCTFVVVNSFVRPPFGVDEQRLQDADVDDFLHDYQPSPDVSNAWLQEGTIWFARDDVSSRVVIEEGVDEDDETVAFRQLREGGVGAIQQTSRADFAQRYVMTDDDNQDHLTDERFWVMGSGICAAFISRADAQAFLYETSALLRLPESAIGIYVGHGLAVPRAMRAVGVGGATTTATGIGGGGLAGSSGTMVVTTFGGAGGGGGGGWPGSPALETFTVPLRLPETQQPQTLWERLTASDD